MHSTMARFEKFFVVLAAVLACFVAGQESSSTFSEEEAMLFFGGDKELGTTATPYSAWLQDVSGGRTYDRAHFLPASGSARDAKKGAAIFWKIHGGNNEEESTEDFVQSLSRTSSTQPWIQFAVVVQADGWVGFGLSEAGGMLGSDMVVWDARDPTRVRDGYVVEDRYPQEDDCDDWDLINIIANDDGWIILEVARNLDTGDSQDHPIVDDSIIASAGARIISAWGDMEFGYHGNNVARSNVRLFAGAEAVAATPEAYHQHLNTTADGSFIIQSKEYTIPARETRYYQPCFTYQDILSQIPDVAEGQSVTLIGAGPVLSPETEQFVHHFVVYGSNREDACEQTSVLAAWAPGERGLELPANVGFPILGEGQPKSILIEIHYNNPELVQNQIDSSGMRFYFSFAPREFEAAFLEIGDPFIQLGGTPIPDGLTEWTFECDTACSRFALGSESVTVFQESLHMHTSGTRMVNELVRDEEVVHTSAVEVFDFDQQGSYRVPMQPYEVKPGDTFRTSCYYRDGNQFGTSSQEEMCISFLLYYPAKRLTLGDFDIPWVCLYGIPTPICTETLTSRTLGDEVDLGRKFGISSLESCAPQDIVASDPTVDKLSTASPVDDFSGDPITDPQTADSLNDSSSGGSEIAQGLVLGAATTASFFISALAL